MKRCLFMTINMYNTRSHVNNFYIFEKMDLNKKVSHYAIADANADRRVMTIASHSESGAIVYKLSSA